MHIHDVLIIGAGPCGLAIAARLREYTPSATFTDDEHQRYHWIRKHGHRMNIKNYRTTMDMGTDNANDNRNIDILVLDGEGDTWMTRWNRLFKTFGIKHLRSPMFFHVDPADRDGLLAHAYETSKTPDLLELPGCAGKELSKHRKKKKHNGGRISQSGADVDERDRKDYFTPATRLFGQHCQEVARRYRLGSQMLRQEKVVDMEHIDASEALDSDDESITSGTSSIDDTSKVFRVTTDQNTHFAHIVVLAVGPGNAPSVPRIAGLPLSSTPHPGFCHAMQIKQFPPPQLISKVQAKHPTSILIIGGGLTSAQLADLAISHNINRVHLLIRGPLKVKYFDVDLDWVGKFRNFNQAAFWSADTDQERHEMIMKARNGGSITPKYKKIIEAHVKTGKLNFHLHTKLESVKWDEQRRLWTNLRTSTGMQLPEMDFIVFATGVQTDIEKMPFLDTIRKQYPIEYVGGLPCLTDDLMWSEDVPLFASGRLAGLRLGPGAPNLVGARIGAERIAWNINDYLEKLKPRSDEVSRREKDELKKKQDLEEYAGGRRNRFDSLVDMPGN